MCLIVDANVATQVFTPDPAPDFAPVWEAILGGQAVAVHGGHLTAEYAKLARIRPLLLELERQGKVRLVANDEVQSETARYAREPQVRSDDPHVLGLASAAHVRLLCSHDLDLHADFTNPDLLRPSGSVYQNVSHRHLIRKHCKGKQAARRRRSRKR